MSTLAIDSVFSDRYRVLRQIAVGGMGEVYEVEHITTRRRCALKVMLPAYAKNFDAKARFELEARIAALVDSALVVDVLDAGVDESTQMPFIVMELLRGQDLGTYLDGCGRMSFGEVVQILHQVSRALARTHAAGIVHRDLKPENIFRTEDEEGRVIAKILDFGTVKLLGGEDISSKSLHMIGSPYYMSPEQLCSENVSPASDTYALSMLAYTLLVGTPYWYEEGERITNVFAFGAEVLKGLPESAVNRAHRYGVILPVDFDGWFLKGAALDPAQRFQNAHDCIVDLAHVLKVPLPQYTVRPVAGFSDRPTVSKLEMDETNPGVYSAKPIQSLSNRKFIPLLLVVCTVGIVWSVARYRTQSAIQLTHVPDIAYSVKTDTKEMNNVSDEIMVHPTTSSSTESVTSSSGATKPKKKKKTTPHPKNDPQTPTSSSEVDMGNPYR